MTVDAELSELSGHLRRIEVEVPENIQIIEVTSEGLTDWTISGDHRLSLDVRSPDHAAEAASSRPWLGFPSSKIRCRSPRASTAFKTPWFWWNGVEVEHRFLDDLVDREAGDAGINGSDLDFFRVLERPW